MISNDASRKTNSPPDVWAAEVVTDVFSVPAKIDTKIQNTMLDCMLLLSDTSNQWNSYI